jgi:hypothetical protein
MNRTIYFVSKSGRTVVALSGLLPDINKFINTLIERGWKNIAYKKFLEIRNGIRTKAQFELTWWRCRKGGT